MKKYFYLTTILFLIANTSFGQSDAKAIEILDQVSVHMKTFKTMYGEFQFILEDDETINPAKIFDIYQKGFKVKFVSQKFEGTRAIYVINLFPTDKSKPFSRITLKIDKDKKELYVFKRFDKDGNYYTIKIGKITPSKTITDSMFSFNKAKHPGVEIIDLRD